MLQEALELLIENMLLLPEDLDANMEIFFWISPLPHSGHFTSLTALELKTNSSNGCPQF